MSGVARCLSEGADPDARDKDGWVPLHRAARVQQGPSGGAGPAGCWR
ncbi:MAG: ankyrin repeat domain-containing protein [Synechococcus sp. SB0667_bin_8]|nr:ankyrin repeat domain-containing protein [Synechococcus sp. SB0667_bin_8]